MGFIFRLFFNLILWGIGLILLMSFVKAIFGAGSNSESRKAKSKAKLQETLDTLKEGLVPVEEDELRALSRKIQTNRVNKSINAGYFNTLFQEPVMAYAMTKESDSTLILAETTDSQYYIDYDGTNAKVFLRNKLIGTIDEEFQFYISEPKEVKAIIDVTSYPQYDVIKIAGEPTVYLNSDSKPNPSSHDRLFAMCNELETADRDILMSLTLYYILIKTNNKKA